MAKGDKKAVLKAIKNLEKTWNEQAKLVADASKVCTPRDENAVLRLLVTQNIVSGAFPGIELESAASDLGDALRGFDLKSPLSKTGWELVNLAKKRAAAWRKEMMAIADVVAEQARKFKDTRLKIEGAGKELTKLSATDKSGIANAKKLMQKIETEAKK